MIPRDSELVNLIDHYRWKLEWTPDNVWNITGNDGIFRVEHENLRLALDKALDAQRKWSIGA